MQSAKLVCVTITIWTAGVSPACTGFGRRDAGGPYCAIANQRRCAILVRDNDALFCRSFRDLIRALGLDDRPTQPASPWQNGHVERLIGSIRRECLDHVIILSQSHLRRLMKAYAEYYNTDRPHLALGKQTPLGRPVEKRGRIVSHARLGGLHRRYTRTR